jgi:hypothetical protein
MNYKYICIILIGMNCFCACNIHPLPENVSGVDTYTIVRKIRCEAREAVIKKAIAYLKYEDTPFVRRKLEKIDINKTNQYIRIFAQTGIVFSFTLQGTENGELTLTSDLIKPLNHGYANFYGTLGGVLNRTNTRAFTISDNFLELVQEVKDDYCNFDVREKNYSYPIVGNIGIDEIIDTFVDMSLFNRLGNPNDISTNSKRGPPTMADTITFTTTITGGITPKIVFTPVGRALQLLDATLIATASRIDKHSVIVGIGLPTAPIYKTNAIPSFVTANTKDHSGESAAIQAVNQQIERFEVSKPIITSP